MDPRYGEPEAVPAPQSLFRAEVAQARSEALGQIILANPPGAPFYLSIIGAMIAVGGTAVVLLPYNQTKIMTGWVAPVSTVARVEAPVSGVISNILVRPGARVSANQQLISISTDTGLANGRTLSPFVVQSLQGQRAELERQIVTVAGKFDSEAQEVAAQLLSNRAKISGATADMDLLKQREALARDQVERMQALVDQGFGARIELNRRQEMLLAATQELSRGTALLAELAADRRELEARQAGIAPRRANEISTVRQSMASLDQASARASAEGGVMLRAPAAGRVSTITASVGETVAPGRSVMSILPDNDARQIWLSVSPDMVTRLKSGDQVKLRYPAYPYQRYGSFFGTIADISDVPIMPGDAKTPSSMETPAYRVIVKPMPTAMRGRTAPVLMPGMSAEAVITIEKQPLWKFLLNTLFGRGNR